MKLLVPLDGSDLSKSVIPAARRLTELVPGLELHLLMVLDPKDFHGRFAQTPNTVMGAGVPGSQGPVVPQMLPRLAETRGAAIEQAEANARDWTQHLIHEELPELNVTVHVEWSREAVDAIISAADRLGADAIAMATHGRSGISHALAGSVTEGVMRRSHRPVLVMGPGTRNRP